VTKLTNRRRSGGDALELTLSLLSIALLVIYAVLAMLHAVPNGWHSWLAPVAVGLGITNVAVGRVRDRHRSSSGATRQGEAEAASSTESETD
jgi:membrane protein required for beta-lactamase induction